MACEDTPGMRRPRGSWLIAIPLAGLVSACSVRTLAVNKLGDALASGGATYGTDDDPELIRAAVPFSLKLVETLLAESPRHRGLLLAAASGFTQYAYAFVHQDADEIESTSLAEASELRRRARKLYLRAWRYGMRGLEVRHAGFEEALRREPHRAVLAADREDVAQLYWTAAALGAAISLAKDDPGLVARLPAVEALIDRALALDEAFGAGAIHGFLINFEMVRPGARDPEQRARQRFERAMELSRGRQAAPLVALAEALAVPRQDLAEFESLLARALAIAVDDAPDVRLSNLVMQRRARWLLARKDELFLIANE
jgi:predicted anti-sigma-YlaC factor YlaD